MNSIDVKKYIQTLQSRGIVLGLGTMKRLLSELDNPEKSLRIIHIAGTNGKGSVGAYLSSILEGTGKSVARFVSPCVGDYENTFLLNSKPVPRDILQGAAVQVKAAVSRLDDEGVMATGFLAGTALAFCAFNMLMPDYAIIECGMGGRDDATNAVADTALSVITKISLDHTAFLGKTLAEISKNKAGIIRRKTPVVSAIQDDTAMLEIEHMCKITDAPLHVASPAVITDIADTQTTFTVDKVSYSTKMLGTYQPENAAVAITAAKALGVCDADIQKGIANAHWDYRFHKIGRFILDGAHNPDGARSLAASLGVYTKKADTAFICACFKDKAYEEIAHITSPYADCVYCIDAPTERGLPRDLLCGAFKAEGANAYTAKTLADAIRLAGTYKNVIIFGTLSILSEAKDIIERF